MAYCKRPYHVDSYLYYSAVVEVLLCFNMSNVFFLEMITLSLQADRSYVLYYRHESTIMTAAGKKRSGHETSCHCVIKRRGFWEYRGPLHGWLSCSSTAF